MKVQMAKDVAQVLGPLAANCENIVLRAAKFAAMPDDESDKESRKKFLSELVNMRSDRTGYEIRRSFLETSLPRDRLAETFRARLQARLIVNQAGGVIENAGFCLDRHFGIPMISGTALKGVSRAAALREVSEGKAELKEWLAVFGWSSTKEMRPYLLQAGAPKDQLDSSFAGMVSFLPAWAAESAELTLDVVTCHYRDYYGQEEGFEQALDVEDPVPNIFPAVEAGCEFIFAIAPAGASTERKKAVNWLQLNDHFDPLGRAREWLLLALTNLGVGAKTRAGYGWFSYDLEAEAERKQKLEEKLLKEKKERARKAEDAARKASMSPFELALEEISNLDQERFANFARLLEEKSKEEQRAFLRILKTERFDRWKAWKKKKKDLAELIYRVAADVGEELQ